MTLSENCDVMNEGTWHVYQLHHDVISALLSVKCTEVIIDMKRNQKVWVFWGKYIFSINKITVNTNTFIIYQWLVIVWKWQNYRNGLPDHLKYLQMHCETSLLKKQNEYYRQNCDLAHKVTF